MGRFLESLKKIWGCIKRRWKYFLPSIVIMLFSIVDNSFGALFILLFGIFAFFCIVIYSLFAFFFGDIQAKNKAKKIMPPAFTNVALYFFFLFGILNDIFYIPFYYLNPAYYKFQSECKNLPKPVIYNQDYWEAFTDRSTLKWSEGWGYSKKLDKKFSAIKWWDEDKKIKKATWWGYVSTLQKVYDGVHYATVTSFSYNGLVFRFGVEKISFGYETLWCQNYEIKGRN